jgi:exoribonuclease R
VYLPSGTLPLFPMSLTSAMSLGTPESHGLAMTYRIEVPTTGESQPRLVSVRPTRLTRVKRVTYKDADAVLSGRYVNNGCVFFFFFFFLRLSFFC